MKKTPDIPDFRFKALEDKYCLHMEALLKILTEQKSLKEEYAMQRMLDILKNKDWEHSIPMHHYLQPLKDSIEDLRNEMIEMRVRTITHCKYRMAQNEEMATKVNTMVRNDVICQWLMGNELKVDQIKFLYNVIEVIYESPCRERLLKRDPEILNVTIPMLTVFKTLLSMRDWINNKEEHVEKMKKLGLPEE